MKKPFSLILITAALLPFVSCTSTEPGRDTVFHRAEDNPRSGSASGSQRYGHGGTHSPGDPSPNRRARRDLPADPDGIVKPRDLDPDPGNPDADPSVAGAGDPANNSSTGGGTQTGPATSSSGEVPYAEAVPGKYGLVYSPFVANKKDGLVNVTDENNVPLPPGTEVTDPHTGKIFRVP